MPVPFKPARSETILRTHGEKAKSIKIRGGDLYAGEVEDMADAILLGNSPRVSLEDSRGTVATILALIQSAKTGKPARAK